MTVLARPPVMQDVARLAGVSSMTVSRVINGHSNIRAETRECVERAITELGYRPNAAARALAVGRSGMVGIISGCGNLFGPASTHRAVEDAALEAGYIPSSVRLPVTTDEGVAAAVERLIRVGVDGIVVTAGQDATRDLAREPRSRVPLVVMEDDVTRPAFRVGVAHAAGARAATEHLLGLGHRGIIHLGGPNDSAQARARVSGWRDTMVGFTLRPELIMCDGLPESGYAVGLALADRADVTAVFAGSDQMAIGLLRGLHDRGRRVPEDVSVVGFDDMPEAAYLTPPLTTVRQDFAAIGARAIELMTVAIQDERTPTAFLLEPTLVVRDSTGGFTPRAHSR